jgi:hypothetical protein
VNCAPINDRPPNDEATAGPQNIASQPALANLVRYARRGAEGLELAGVVRSSEVLFIDEATPTPEMPERRARLPSNRQPQNDDVFYIGPE